VEKMQRQEKEEMTDTGVVARNGRAKPENRRRYAEICRMILAHKQGHSGHFPRTNSQLENEEH
jgi:hypothetical protein